MGTDPSGLRGDGRLRPAVLCIVLQIHPPESRLMRRLRAMIVKEVWAVLRDPKSRIVLVVPPIIQLFIFTFASTLEVKNVEVGIYDRSGGAASAELVQRIAGSPNVSGIHRLASADALKKAIDNQQVLAAI